VIANIETSNFIMLPLDKIISRFLVRRLSPLGLSHIQESIRDFGFLEHFSLVVAPIGDGTYLLIDGNHRYQAAKALCITQVPCLIKRDLSEDEMYRLAIMSNHASGTVVPMTLVNYAEFVWERSKEGKTLLAIGEMLGWTETKTKNYSALSAIDMKAWRVIVTTFEDPHNQNTDNDGTTKVTPVTFTENLLRNILDLTPSQQLDLIQKFTHPSKDERITKGKFIELAKAYLGRNEMKTYTHEKLGNVGEPLTIKLLESIDSGAYDTEWQKSKDNGNHPKLDKLIEAIRAEWEKANSIYLEQGDFYEKVRLVGEGSIDLIITDPPYNIANERKFTFNGRTSISQDFGEWDKYHRKDFIALFDVWVEEWKRILREGGSGYVFTSDIYLSYLQAALEQADLSVKTTIVWHKTNPAPQVEKVTFQSSVEYILFFVKGKEHTFNWQGDGGEMHNFIESSICMGSERLENAQKQTLHPTQKPVKLLRHLIEVSSNRGDMVFDGFAGVGSSGVAAKELGRKFTGIERDTVFFQAMQRRLADE
jgi:DNA modification methylase